MTMGSRVEPLFPEMDKEGSDSDQELNRGDHPRNAAFSFSSLAPTASTSPSMASDGSLTNDDVCDSVATFEFDGIAPAGVQIICVGVMRTGVKTLHRALRNLGYSNIWDEEDIFSSFDQWDMVMRSMSTKDALERIFHGSEVIMGMPTTCFWEQLVKLYPDAKVILTVRDEDDWWESVRHAGEQIHRDLLGAPLRYGSWMRSLEAYLMPSYHRFCEVLRFAWAATLGAYVIEGHTVSPSIARSSYRKHNSYVEFVLGDKKSASGGPTLLVYNVKDGWAPLCEFLDRDIPEVEFPVVKHVPRFPGEPACENEPKGLCFEEMMRPDSDFGMRLRREMRWGLMKAFIATTTLLSAVLGVLSCAALKVPVALIAACYLVLVGICWTVYVVINNLVLRVPALVVLPMAMTSFLIAGALQLWLLSYGMLTEMLVTQDRIASPVLVLSSRFGAIVCSALLLLVTDGTLRLGAPITSMAMFAFTNEAATFPGYEMLKYISFPVTVMAKSVRMLPSMLMGRVLNRIQYSAFQDVQAVALLVCVSFMHLSEESGQHPQQQRGGAGVVEDDLSPTYKLGMGVAVLILLFVFDRFTSQWQDTLYKRHPNMSQTQMMLGGNSVGFLLTSGTLFAAWPKTQESAALTLENPAILGRIVALGVVYALGQFCIYSAIRMLGPLSFTWIMTARQLLSVFMSPVNEAAKIACICIVFAIMSATQLAKAMPKFTRQARRVQRKPPTLRAAACAQFGNEAMPRKSCRRPSEVSTVADTEDLDAKSL